MKLDDIAKKQLTTDLYSLILMLEILHITLIYATWHPNVQEH